MFTAQVGQWEETRRFGNDIQSLFFTVLLALESMDGPNSLTKFTRFFKFDARNEEKANFADWR